MFYHRGLQLTKDPVKVGILANNERCMEKIWDWSHLSHLVSIPFPLPVGAICLPNTPDL